MNNFRIKVLQIFIIVAFAIMGIRLLYLQVIDNRYKRESASNVMRYEMLYPPRGEVFDRNGQYIVQSKESYDLMAIPIDVEPFDTLKMATLIGVSREKLVKEFKKAVRYSRRRPSVIIKQLTKEEKLRLDELNIKGFYTIYRTIRSYPQKIAGNMLGYVGEVNDRIINNNNYYRSGDYIGMSGVESAYEEVLRGEKGVKINMVDVHGVSKGSYAEGAYDTLPKSGTSITCSIDAELQKFGEELLEGKIGSIVAIEPATGEILMMVNTPTYDPDELVGRQRGNNYMDLLNNKRRPLFNRAVMARYPPGSIFKIVNGLIGLQEGVLTPSTKYPCIGGYTVGRGVKCHNHISPVDLDYAVRTSCNAYFCYVMRDIIDNRKYGSVKKGLDVWSEYVKSFGFGVGLNSDFNGELKGYVPAADFYNKYYDGRWNSLTVISLSIGQGELGCTPLQMANLAAIIANRGHYFTPHVVSRIHDRDSIDTRFYEKHNTLVDDKHFNPIVQGMFDAVHKNQGTARVAYIPGLDVCGKTGTAQNPRGEDHSTFMCFAPKDNPKIAVSVYVENGGFGARIAAPVASLIVEKYLNDSISSSRLPLIEYVKGQKIDYSVYDE